MATLADLTADIELYTTYDDTDFVASIPRFIEAAEERIWYFVQLPNFRTTTTGTMSIGDALIELPANFLAAAGFYITIPVTLETRYLLNKDVEYLREVYPVAATTGVPFVYSIYQADADETVLQVAPTPAATYAWGLSYFYRPASLTTNPADGTWLSNHAYDTLLYGALSESAVWLKKNAGIDNMGDTYEQRFLIGLQGLKNLGESRDRKDTYRSGEKRKAEAA